MHTRLIRWRFGVDIETRFRGMRSIFSQIYQMGKALWGFCTNYRKGWRIAQNLFHIYYQVQWTNQSDKIGALIGHYFPQICNLGPTFFHITGFIYTSHASIDDLHHGAVLLCKCTYFIWYIKRPQTLLTGGGYKWVVSTRLLLDGVGRSTSDGWTFDLELDMSSSPACWTSVYSSLDKKWANTEEDKNPLWGRRRGWRVVCPIDQDVAGWKRKSPSVLSVKGWSGSTTWNSGWSASDCALHAVCG